MKILLYEIGTFGHFFWIGAEGLIAQGPGPLDFSKEAAEFTEEEAEIQVEKFGHIGYELECFITSEAAPDPYQKRYDELHAQMEATIATFQVGDSITFTVANNDSAIRGCDEDSEDSGNDVELVGKILKIEGSFAVVEHKYGVCRTWLAIAKKYEQ